MAAHSYWRILITANVDGGHLVGMTEVSFLDGSGTPVSLLGGTASASSHNLAAPGSNSYAANAFDGDTGTYWQAANVATVNAPEWLQYQFAASVDVAGLSMRTFAGGPYYFGPRDFSLQFSDDGSSWTTLYDYLGVGWNPSGAAQTFNAANAAPATAAIIWRIFITEGDGGIVFINQVRLYDASNNLIPTGRYAATASSVTSPSGNAPWFAFDGDVVSGNIWGTNSAPSSGAPEWLAYQFGTVQQVSRYCIHGWPSGSIVQNDASTFSLQYSLDGGTSWSVADTQTNFPWTYPPDTCWTLSSVLPVTSTCPGGHQRGNIDWDQIGLDARHGDCDGILVQYSDGTHTVGNIPHFLSDGTLTDSGVSSTTAGSSVVLQTGGTNNASQSTLNLVGGTGVTVTDVGSGQVTIASALLTPVLDSAGNPIVDSAGNWIF